jgi:hypothetical protein
VSYIVDLVTGFLGDSNALGITSFGVQTTKLRPKNPKPGSDSRTRVFGGYFRFWDPKRGGYEPKSVLGVRAAQIFKYLGLTKTKTKTKTMEERPKLKRLDALAWGDHCLSCL